MSKLIWIDDSIQGLMPIVDNVFPLIWQGGHSVDAILFGNDHCKRNNEESATEEERCQLEQYMRARFIQFCESVDAETWVDEGSTYNRKRELIDNSRVSLVPLVASRSESADCDIHTLVQLWTDDKALSTISSGSLADTAAKQLEEMNMGVGKLVSAMNIPENAVVALDVCLLYKDLTRLGDGQPVISMAIFNDLQKTHPYYLYSGEATPSTLNQSWKEIYCRTFPSTSGEKFSIYPKKSLSNNNSLAPAKQQLLTLLNQGNGEKD